MQSEDLHTLTTIDFITRPELYAGFIAEFPKYISKLFSLLSNHRMVLLFSVVAPLGLLGLCLVIAGRRKAELRVRAAAMFQPPQSASVELGASLDEAERALGLLYRRMEVYLQDPYDFARSRIRDDESFDRNLDFAVALNLHVTALVSGVTQHVSEDRAQVRQQVLEGLMRRVALRKRNVLYPTGDRRGRSRSSQV